MFNRDTRNLVFFANTNDSGSLFSFLPRETLQKIWGFEISQETYTYEHPDFPQALQHVANGDLDKLKAMLDENPLLLYLRADYKDAHITLLEFAFLDGDPDMVTMILPYFDQLACGWEERERQKARCRPHIEILEKQLEAKQPALDLGPLFEIIKQAKPADVTAALEKDINHDSPLGEAMRKFRKAVRQKTKSGGMHYEHYTTLIQAFALLDDEWDTLSNNDTNYDKCRLVSRQIIGFLQRGLPFVDKSAFARAFDDAERTLKFKYGNGAYPACSDVDDATLTGLGFDMWIYGGRRGGSWLMGPGMRGVGCFYKHMSNKNFRLAELMQPQPKQEPSSCLIA